MNAPLLAIILISIMSLALVCIAFFGVGGVTFMRTLPFPWSRKTAPIPEKPDREPAVGPTLEGSP